MKNDVRLFVYMTVLLFCLLSLPSCARDPEPFVKQTFLMGTRGTITIYGLADEKAAAAAADGFSEMHRIESVMSTWKEDSEISRLNRNGQNRPFKVSKELFLLINKIIQYSNDTGGAFDVTARSVVRLWGFQGGEPKLPTDQELFDAIRKSGWRKIVLDAADTSVTLHGGATIDLAGIGKGYAVDRCVAVLKEHGVESGLVDLGGNMFAIGTPPGREAWSIGIRDPEDSGGVVGKLLISDEAVATSGNYENFVTIDGKKYGHIIDPRTGRTVDHVLGVTVITRTAMESDVLSTALFVLGHEEAMNLSGAFPGIRAVFALPGDTFEFVGNFGGKLDLFD